MWGMAWMLAVATAAPGMDTPVEGSTAEGPPPLELLTTGGLGGLGASTVQPGLLDVLEDAFVEASLSLAGAHSGSAVVMDGHVIWQARGRLDGMAEWMTRGPENCSDEETLLVQHDEAAWVGTTETLNERLVFDEMAREAWTIRSCEREGGGSVFWASQGVREWPNAAETITTVWPALMLEGVTEGQPWTVPVIFRPFNEASRTASVIAADRIARPDAVWVEAGNFLDGASAVQDGELSLLREPGWSLLARLRPDVLVPGPQELAPGPLSFLQEAGTRGLSYIATNWSSDDPVLQLPSVWRKTVGSAEDAWSIAVLGVVEPALQDGLTLFEMAGVTLTDPLEAVSAAVDALLEEDHPPDLIVLAGVMSPQLRERLHKTVEGIDIFLDDRDGGSGRLIEQRSRIRRQHSATGRSPVTVDLHGVTQVTVSRVSEDEELLTVTPIAVGASTLHDREVANAVSSVRLNLYPSLEDEVIPGSTEEPWSVLPREDWRRLICEAVLELSGADVAYLDDIPDPPQRPGALRAIDVANTLASMDRLELVRLDGDRLKDILNMTHGVADLQCGAPTGKRFPTVGGRYIEAPRTYLAVTTDRARQGTTLGSLLQQGRSDLIGDLPKTVPFLDETGTQWTLQRAVLTMLRSWREAMSEGWLAPVLTRSPTRRLPQWVLRVHRLGLQVDRFSAPATTAYAEVPETLLNSPSSLTLGADLNAELEYSDADVSWNFKVGAAFSEVMVDDADPQESADDLRLSTAFRVPRWRLPRKGASMTPYGEVLWDSEFTPLIDGDGMRLPRQSDLSLTLGVSVLRWRWLQSLNVGPFVNRDLGRLEDKTFEWGGRMTAGTAVNFLPGSALRWSTLWDVAVFADTALDDAADLRLRLWGENRLTVRVWRWLSLSGYVQGLVVQGRVPETRRVASSLKSGVALEVTTAALLNRRSR